MCDNKYIMVDGKKVTTDDLYQMAYTCRYGHPEEIAQIRYKIASIIESHIELIADGGIECLK